MADKVNGNNSHTSNNGSSVEHNIKLKSDEKKIEPPPRFGWGNEDSIKSATKGWA